MGLLSLQDFMHLFHRLMLEHITEGMSRLVLPEECRGVLLLPPGWLPILALTVLHVLPLALHVLPLAASRHAAAGSGDSAAGIGRGLDLSLPVSAGFLPCSFPACLSQDRWCSARFARGEL